MFWFLWTMLVVVGCAAGAVLAGRALAAALRLRPLLKSSAEAFAAAALLGTAAWVLACGWLSYAGVPMRVAAALLAGATPVLATWVGLRRGWAVFVPCRAGVAGAALTMLAAGAAVLHTLPLAVGETFAVLNDTLIRLVLSEVLQEHGLYAAADGGDAWPLAWVVAAYQEGGLHIGSAFALASVEALLPGLRAIDVYPAVSAWGVCLNVLGFFLLARWGLALSRSMALLGAFLLAVAPNPMHWAAANGFLPQTYGTAALALGLALLARVAPGPRPDRGMAFLLGASWAFLLSVYVELLPVLGFAVAALALRAVIRRREANPRPLLRTLAAALGVAALLGNVELVRAVSALPGQLDAVVGWDITWDWAEFWSFALGTRIGIERTDAEPMVGWVLLTAIASTLLVLGLVRSLAHHVTPAVVAALGVLAALGAYFALLARNPWTGEIGHTWSVFKVAQWVFPLALALQCAGLESARGRWRRLVVAGVAALALPLALPAQLGLAQDRVQRMQEVTASDRPFAAYRQLAATVDAERPSLIYLVDPRDGPWPRDLIAYFLDGRAIAYDDGDLVPSTGGPDGARPLILFARPPAYGCFAMLPGGVARVEESPVILAVRQPGGGRSTVGRRSLVLPGGTTALRLWAPRAGMARLTASVDVAADRSESKESWLEFEASSGHSGQVRLGDDPHLTIDVPVPAGPTDLRLTSPRRRELRNLQIGAVARQGDGQTCGRAPSAPAEGAERLG